MGVKSPKLFSEKQCHVYMAYLTILSILLFLSIFSGKSSTVGVGGWSPLFRTKSVFWYLSLRKIIVLKTEPYLQYGFQKQDKFR